jgi:hypothetical protein
LFAAALAAFPGAELNFSRPIAGDPKTKGIRKSRDVTRETPFLHVEFSQLELQQSQVDDIACNA